MATVSDAIQKTLREELEPTIHDYLPKLDPVYPQIKRSFKNVKNTGIGRGHKVIKTFRTGVAGGAKFEGVAGGNVLSGSHYNVFDTPPTFPAIDETTNPAYFTAEVSLIKQKGNFYIPTQYLRADQYDSAIGSVVSDLLQGVAELVANQECGMFYAGGTYKEFGDLGDTSATVTNLSGDTAAMVVDLDGTSASGRVHRFLEGMLVDLYDSTGATQRNNDFTIVVDTVDPDASTIVLKRMDGATFQTTTTLNGGITYGGAGGDNDIIVLKDSVSQGPTNLNSWIVNSGTLFGMDLAVRSRFKSILPASIGAALSESKLNQAYYRYYRAFPTKSIRTAITTDGVLLGLIDNLDGFVSGSNSQDGRMRYDRNGEALMAEMGWEGFKYRFGGKAVTIYTSGYCEEGFWYGINLEGGNIVRHVPPGLPGAKMDGRIGQELEFVAPIGGSTGIFAHATSAGKLTDYAQAPFERQWQILPTDPVSLKMVGITQITLIS